MWGVCPLSTYGTSYPLSNYWVPFSLSLDVGVLSVSRSGVPSSSSQMCAPLPTSDQVGLYPPLNLLLTAPSPPAAPGCQILIFPGDGGVGFACPSLPPGPAEQAFQARRQPITAGGEGEGKPSAGDLGRWPCSKTVIPGTAPSRPGLPPCFLWGVNS